MKKGYVPVIAFYNLLFIIMLHIYGNSPMSYSGYLWVVLFYFLNLFDFHFN